MKSDKELLFAVFVTRLSRMPPSRITEAASAAEKGGGDESLGGRLVGLGILGEAECKLFEELVEAAVAAHNEDAASALEAFGGRKHALELFSGVLSDSELDRMATVPMSQVSFLDETGELVKTQEESPGRYSHISQYARGGMGRVLLVHDEQIGRNVALKELLPDLDPSSSEGMTSPLHKTASLMSRFLHEARITAQLEHPSIVPVYEIGRRRDGRFYYTMKLVRGQTLARAIAARKSLSERLQLLPNFVALCQAVAYAHNRHVIHRDIKPANIMVGEFGETMVLDWGLARRQGLEDPNARDAGNLLDSCSESDAPQTAYGKALGTPNYMPPEQAEGRLEDVDERSDVYSLGAVLYEILTGRPPYTGESVRDIIQQVTGSPLPPVVSLVPDAPPELVSISERCLNKDSGKRYDSARELAEEVSRFMSGALVQSYAYSFREIAKRYYRKNRPVVHTAAIAAVMIAVLTVVAFVRISLAKDREQEQRVLAEAARHVAETRSYLATMRAVPALIEQGRYDMALASLWQTPEACRNWEWGYFLRQCRRDIFALPGQRGLALSPDGTRIATVSGGDTAAVWDAATGRRITALAGHTGPVTSVAFSPDGTRAVTASHDCTARIWDAETGDCVLVLRGHKDFVLDAAFSPTGDFVVGRAFDNSSRMWDARSGREPFMLFDGSFDVRCVSFSPDGKVFAMSLRGATAQIRDSRSGKRLATFPGNEEPLLSAVFSPDASRIVTECGWRQIVTLWDARNADKIRVLTTRISQKEFEDVAITTGFNSGTAELQNLTTGATVVKITGEGTPVQPVFSPDGTLIAAGHRDGSLGLWDGHSGKPHLSFEHVHDPILCASFSPDSAHIAVGCLSGAIEIYDTATGTREEVLKGHSSAVERVVYAPGGGQLYSSAGSVRKWMLGRRAPDTYPMQVPARRTWGPHVTLTPDGNFTVGDMDGKFTTGRVEDGKRFVVCQNYLLSHMDAALRCGRDRLAAVCSSNVWVWNTATGEAVHCLEGHDSVIECLTVAENHPLAATGDAQGNVRIWDLDEGREQVAIDAHREKVCAVAFGSDGHLLATAAPDEAIRIWQSADGSLVREIPRLSGYIRALGFASGGPWLAAASGKTIHIWDKSDPSRRVTCAGHLEDVRDFTFSPDGSRLVSASADRSLRVWDVETGIELACLRGHAAAVVAVMFVDDGTSLISVGDDLEFRIWRTVPWDVDDLPRIENASREARFDAWLLARAAAPQPQKDCGPLHLLVVKSPEEMARQLETLAAVIESGTALSEVHGDTGVTLRHDLDPAYIEGLCLAQGDILLSINGASIVSGREGAATLNATARAISEGTLCEVPLEASRDGRSVEIVIRLKEVECIEKEQGVSGTLVKLFGREAIDILKRGISLFEPARKPNGEVFGIRITGVDGLFQNQILVQLGLAEDNVCTQLDGCQITSVQHFIDMLDEIFAGIKDGTVNKVVATIMRGKFQRMLLTLRDSDPGVSIPDKRTGKTGKDQPDSR
jgi:eukaryotic-like serine/threonine-protein kinase